MPLFTFSRLLVRTRETFSSCPIPLQDLGSEVVFSSDRSGGAGNRSTSSEIAASVCQTGYSTTVLYRQHHLQKRSWPLVFSIHFLLCRPVSCGVYDDVNGAASPPDHIYTIATRNTGHTKWRSSRRLDLFGFTWFGWKLVVHFCVVCTDIF